MKKTDTTASASTSSANTGKHSMTCLSAAIRVLEERDDQNLSLSTDEMIERMAAKGYWQSARGKTPAGTLCSTISGHIKSAGEHSLIIRAGPNKYTLRPRMQCVITATMVNIGTKTQPTWDLELDHGAPFIAASGA